MSNLQKEYLGNRYIDFMYMDDRGAEKYIDLHQRANDCEGWVDH